MPLSADDRAFLKHVIARLKPEESLQAGDSRYENVYNRPGCEDPTELIQNEIELASEAGVIFFSGFSGSGKTTELFRLQERLNEAGYTVLYANSLEYLNPNVPIDISDLLIILAGALSDALAARDISMNSSTYWGRFWKWLKTTNVELKEIKLKAGLPDETAGAELKLELKSTPDFRQRLVEALKDRIGVLRQEVASFFEDGYKAVLAADPNTAGVVFLFDSLEQLKGSLTDSAQIVKSVELLFASHREKLSMPYVHMVYTVPPWLRFVLKGLRVVVIPGVPLWTNDAARQECPPGFGVLTELVQKRFSPGGLERLLGPEYQSRAKTLITLSGGHFRDLLNLIRSVVVRCSELPAPDSAMEHAISETRAQFLPISVEDALRLHRIGAERKTPLLDDSPESVTRLTKFLDAHIVLYLRNGEEWYDIHPLVRDEVDRIVEANKAAATA